MSPATSLLSLDRFALVGVVHLLPLPGAPVASPGFQAVADRACRDAEEMGEGGLRAFIIENLGDAPFAAQRTDPHVAAMLAVIGDRLRRSLGSDFALGVNVLRNDACAALGAAAACGAQFIRVNVLSGATWTDQGLIEGGAHALLRYRRALGLAPDQTDAPVAILADVLVKHGAPAGVSDLSQLARDTAGRGGADALIVTGAHTGGATDLGRVRVARAAAPHHPVWVGSGVTPSTVAKVGEVANGAIVGTWLHREGLLDAPVDRARVRALVDAAAGI